MKLWNQLFLEERSSIGLSFFRIALAFTVMSVVMPSFFHLDDTFFPTAFKQYNTSFFPIEFIKFVQKSPVWLISSFVALFCFSSTMFLLGLMARISCVVTTVCCYYFYALNSFAIGTLSWDILLVTQVLMCVVPYHGDYFSLDALRRQDVQAYKKPRPFFIQRLLQIQIATTFFMTALHKITGSGNWLTGNPLFYLMNSHQQGVVKNFLLKDVLRNLPEVCYWLGIFIVVMEFIVPFLWFCRKTRRSGIVLGWIFHLTLLLTLDVPATFFFLFPAQMLLFINPDDIVGWIEQKRRISRAGVRSKLIYDGKCSFCRSSLKTLKVMDLFDTIKPVDMHQVFDLKVLHSALTQDQVAQRIYLIEPSGRLYGGYFVFRSLCWKMPMMFLMAPLLYFPGSGLIGPLIYRMIAKYRYLLPFVRSRCEDGTCSIS